MKLNQTQQRELIESARFGIEFVDLTIQKLKLECPDAFHTDRTLRKRRFQHKPASPTPCQHYPGVYPQ
ncbi:hypothetical protein [Paraburkholderia sp. J12]|uniref:hypothetical protein n=1 Tax=Paraburkholderia sp. J12 TaxID=2805432 RepID=UPI002ABD6CF2|nr:hypothetical protein [Paraburkholderia sp. J12]